MTKLIIDNKAPLADRFAKIEAEYKAIKDIYDALKEEAINACMDACGPTETKSTVDGEEFYLKFSFTETRTFSQKLAKEFLTQEQFDKCFTGGTRRNLSAEVKPRLASAA